MVLEASLLIASVGNETTPITVAIRRPPGYKYLLRSPSRTISHSFPLSLPCLGFPSLVLDFPTMEAKRGIKRECSPSVEGNPMASDTKTPPSPPGSPSEVSSHYPRLLVFEQGGPPGRLQWWIYLHLRMRKNPSMIYLVTLSSPNVSSISSTMIS
jgi:hypothetical protein